MQSRWYAKRYYFACQLVRWLITITECGVSLNQGGAINIKKKDEVGGWPFHGDKSFSVLSNFLLFLALATVES
jgi:hypothetical protein